MSRKKKGWIIAGSALAALVVFGSIGSAMGNRDRDSDDRLAPAASSTAIEAASDDGPAETESPPTPEPELVEVPAVVGMTATEAWLALTAAGLSTQEVSSFEDPMAIVESTSPSAGEQVTEGTSVTLTVAVAPQFTLAQQNAIRQAQSYLDYAGFSRESLIGQLEYEGYSTEEATFGADNAGADWNAEAAESAEAYLDYTSFSRQGLYDQLAYEGFTPEQIEFGLAHVGY
ncbi:Ltp family lipoprotein [Agrococcus sp. HG114]|uniref:Ltp family lipoprotein n=1 Tax=Agrococcus sp. HG114 TaxID=2969757 RepID=UPI00215B4EC4|nr:Ltp family lipoprotein [Agrococcus sp. HG114]MCR8670529.1 Ltp family lipoprotein [Agrococcus sp. HG114]